MPAEAATVLVDARGQVCPLPVLKLRKALFALPPGGRVRLLATDRQAATDVPAFCAEMDVALEDTKDDGGVLVFTVAQGPR